MGSSSVESVSVMTYSFSVREHSIVRTFLFLTLCAQGEGVSLYGPVGPGYAAFSAQFDGGPSVVLALSERVSYPRFCSITPMDWGLGNLC